MRLFSALFLALALTAPLYAETETDILVEYIIKVHDKSTNCKPCITRQRAQDYADQIEASSISWFGPGWMDYCVGLIQWESDGFINSIDKRGSGKVVLPPGMWCFGMGKLKVATANSFAKFQFGWNIGHITGHQLLHDYRMNIDLSIAHLAWCRDMKGENIRRGMNAYRAGCRGEKKGNYWITVTMPWGEKVRKQYADWVYDCVNQWRVFKKNSSFSPSAGRLPDNHTRELTCVGDAGPGEKTNRIPTPPFHLAVAGF